MAVFQQMLRGQVAALFILQAHAVHVGMVHIAVDQHEGDAQVQGGGEEIILEHAGQHQPGQVPAAADGFQRACVLHGTHHHVVPFLPRALFDAFHEGAQKGVAHGAAGVLRRQVGDDSDNGGMVVGQGAGRHAGHVMLPLDDLPNFLHPLRRHPAFPVVHHVGYGGNAHARFRGDVL